MLTVNHGDKTCSDPEIYLFYFPDRYVDGVAEKEDSQVLVRLGEQVNRKQLCFMDNATRVRVNIKSQPCEYFSQF